MPPALVHNAASPRQVREAGKKERERRHQELEDIRTVLSTKAGRRVIWRYLQGCGVFQSSFTGNSETFFREGERNVGLKLLADVNEAQPDAYLTMLQESRQDEVAEDAAQAGQERKDAKEDEDHG